MEVNKRPIYINITALAVIKIILIFVGFYFLYLIREILAVLFIALILSSALHPWVDWLHKRKIPRGVSVMFVYLILFSTLGAVIYLIIPPIVEQIYELANNFPRILEKVISGFSALKDYSIKYGILDNIKETFGTLSTNVQGAASGVFSTVSVIFGSIFTFFLILVMTFYMIVEEDAIKKLVRSIAPKNHQAYVMHLINRMRRKVGLWLRGQLILSLIIFVVTYLGLILVGLIFKQPIEYALVLALIAGLVEFVPYLGPIIAAVPAVFLTFTQAPIMALAVVVLYYIIQLLENNIIVPKVMQRVIGLNPIVSIAVLLIGFKIGGIIGAVLSIPVATAVSVFIRDLFDNRTKKTGSF